MNPKIKDFLSRTVPAPILSAGKEVYDGLKRVPNLPAAYLNPARRDSIARLAALRDRHRGERCFILGNGPSLKRTDLSKLRNETTFGLNRIYLAFPEMGFEKIGRAHV